MNWSFNIFPLLCPTLNHVYPKMAGKDQLLKKIWINNGMRDDLEWAICHMEASLGVKVLKSLAWDVDDADSIMYCDTCMEGLAFWYLAEKKGYFMPVPSGMTCDIIWPVVGILIRVVVEIIESAEDLRCVVCFWRSLLSPMYSMWILWIPHGILTISVAILVVLHRV